MTTTTTIDDDRAPRPLRRAEAVTGANGRVVVDLVDLGSVPSTSKSTRPSVRASIKRKFQEGAAAIGIGSRKGERARARSVDVRGDADGDARGGGMLRVFVEGVEDDRVHDQRNGNGTRRRHARSVSEVRGNVNPALTLEEEEEENIRSMSSSTVTLRPRELLLSPPPSSPRHWHPASPPITAPGLQHDAGTSNSNSRTPIAMTKLSSKSSLKRTPVLVWLDADLSQLVWESSVDGNKKRKCKIVPIRNIKEIRTSPSSHPHGIMITLIYTLPYPSPSLSMGMGISISPTISRQLSRASSVSKKKTKPLTSGDIYKTLRLLPQTREAGEVWVAQVRAVGTCASAHEYGMEGWERGVWNGVVRRRGVERGRTEKEEIVNGKKGEGEGEKEKEEETMSFEELESLCWRLNVTCARKELERLVKQAASLSIDNHLNASPPPITSTSTSTSTAPSLTFPVFHHFLKLLKARPDVERVYKDILAEQATGSYKRGRPWRGQAGGDVNVTAGGEVHPSDLRLGLGEGVEIVLAGGIGWEAFERFMRDQQRSKLSTDELRIIFNRYAEASTLPEAIISPSPSKAITLVGFTSFLLSADNHILSSSSSFSRKDDADDLDGPSHHHYPFHHRAHHHRNHSHAQEKSPPSSWKPALEGAASPQAEHCTMLSTHPYPITNDMTRPLSEYYIASSHNTYLVGHQLVGESTVEGYIRALLEGCRCVEIDIYPSSSESSASTSPPAEPIVTHGKTLTSKLSLRSVCETIMQYGFVVSPYPIIISAEVHLGVIVQEVMVQVMKEVFGERLVCARVPALDGEKKCWDGRIESLPSPEALRGKILFKTKNLNLSREDSKDSRSVDAGYASFSNSASISSAESAAEDSDVLHSDHNGGGSGGGGGGGGGGGYFGRALGRRRIGRKGRSLSNAILQTSDTAGFLYQFRGGIANPASSLTSQAHVLSPTPMSAPLPSVTTEHTHLLPHNNSNPLPIIQHRSSSSPRSSSTPGPKPKMSPAVLSLLVYTMGVKCRGINKKEVYAPEHMFSLSENAANKMLKTAMSDLIKHCRTHLVRIYPKGMRVNSTNYEPHRYWAGGAQLVAINWQTFDLGYMINNAMFQRNGRAGYVLKPPALRLQHKKELLMKRTSHILRLKIISAQQLPRPKDASGHDITDKAAVSPYVEVTIHIPDWPLAPASIGPAAGREAAAPNSHPPLGAASGNSSTSARIVSHRTSVVKNNGFNPVWEEKMHIPFDCVGDLKDLIFVRFAVKQEGGEDGEPLAVYCASLGNLEHGYRHVPLYDSQLQQYLYSTLFIRIYIEDL